jgi:hypothetical protein
MSLWRSKFVRRVLGFGLVFGVLWVGWDWLTGSLTPWPSGAVRYPVPAVVGGAVYGLVP